MRQRGSAEAKFNMQNTVSKLDEKQFAIFYRITPESN